MNSIEPSDEERESKLSAELEFVLHEHRSDGMPEEAIRRVIEQIWRASLAISEVGSNEVTVAIPFGAVQIFL